MQRIPKSSSARKETVDILILTSRSGGREIMKPIAITNRRGTRLGEWNQFSLFRWTSAKVIPIEKTFDDEASVQKRQQVKDQQSYILVSVAYLT